MDSFLTSFTAILLGFALASTHVEEDADQLGEQFLQPKATIEKGDNSQTKGKTPQNVLPSAPIKPTYFSKRTSSIQKGVKPITSSEPLVVPKTKLEFIIDPSRRLEDPQIIVPVL